MDEIYRMLGAHREAELLAEAERLHRGRRPHAPRPPSETLIGRSALVITACFPTGQVRVGGETWLARCEAGATVGQQVRVRAVEGLTLTVEPDEAS